MVLIRCWFYGSRLSHSKVHFTDVSSDVRFKEESAFTIRLWTDFLALYYSMFSQVNMKRLFTDKLLAAIFAIKGYATMPLLMTAQCSGSLKGLVTNVATIRSCSSMSIVMISELFFRSVASSYKNKINKIKEKDWEKPVPQV